MLKTFGTSGVMIAFYVSVAFASDTCRYMLVALFLILIQTLFVDNDSVQARLVSDFVAVRSSN